MAKKLLVACLFVFCLLQGGGATPPSAFVGMPRFPKPVSRGRDNLALRMSKPDYDQDVYNGATRRRFLAAAAAIAVSPSLPMQASAAGNNLADVLGVFGYGPVPPKDPIASIIEGVLGMKTKERRPKPVKLLRKYVFRPFAVLMMRSCYNTADLLDFVPMDQFQKDFFNLRSDEWEKFLPENDASQGDLSDPKYFDFISAAQFATITQEMRDGKLIFEELTGAEGTKVVVSRGASWPQNNDLLPAALYKESGKLIYDGMLTNFTGKDFPVLVKPPAPVSGGDTEGCKTGITGLYEFLVDNGYCMGADVADLGPLAKQAYHEEVLSLKGWQGLVGEAGAAPKGDGVKLSVTLKSPVILWGRQWLMLQGYMSNDHDVMIVSEFLRRSGRAATVRTTSVTENSITREYNLL